MGNQALVYNDKKKILIVFGTRPEAIKMAPVILGLKNSSADFDVKVCVTGQHRQMLDQVLELFDIKPDFDLDIMGKGQDLYDITTKVLMGLRNILREYKPNIVLVHGDTSTSAAAALASYYEQISVGHVEAGLRTFNIYSPWPEEINRQIIGRIAMQHFTPTLSTKVNLLNEGVNESLIHVTGNTVIDSLFWVLKKIETNLNIKDNIIENLVFSGLSEQKLKYWEDSLKNNDNHAKMVLITGHRRENFGQGFIDICEAIKMLADKFPESDFVYPMHLNPNVREAIEKVFGFEKGLYNYSKTNYTNIHFLEPLDYLPFVFLMSISYIILTDSGGIQEEAPSLGKPVLVMRNTTERPEAVDSGSVKLVGTNKELIISEVSLLLENIEIYNAMSKSQNQYGDGTASFKIVNLLKNLL